MAYSLNSVSLIGNLGADPEVRRLEGTSVCNLRMATTDRYKNKDGEWKDTTEWHNVVAWGDTLCDWIGDNLRKGSKVMISGGKLQTRKWEDREGNDKYTTEVVIRSFDQLIPFETARSGGSEDRGGRARERSREDDRPRERDTGRERGGDRPRESRAERTERTADRDRPRGGGGGGRGDDLDDEIPF